MEARGFPRPFWLHKENEMPPTVTEAAPPPTLSEMLAWLENPDAEGVPDEVRADIRAAREAQRTAWDAERATAAPEAVTASRVAVDGTVAAPALASQAKPGTCTYYCLDETMHGQQGLGAPDGKTRFDIDFDGFARNVSESAGLDRVPQVFELRGGAPVSFVDPRDSAVLAPPGPLRWIEAQDPELAGAILTGPAPYNWKLVLNADLRGFAPDNAGFDQVPGFTVGDYLTPDEYQYAQQFLPREKRPGMTRTVAAQRGTGSVEEMRAAVVDSAQGMEPVSPPRLVIEDRADPNAGGLPPHLAGVPIAPAPRVDPNATGLPAHLLPGGQADALKAQTDARVSTETGEEEGVQDETEPGALSSEDAEAMRTLAIESALGAFTQAQLRKAAQTAQVPGYARMDKAGLAEALVDAKALPAPNGGVDGLPPADEETPPPGGDARLQAALDAAAAIADD